MLNAPKTDAENERIPPSPGARFGSGRGPGIGPGLVLRLAEED